MKFNLSHWVKEHGFQSKPDLNLKKTDLFIENFSADSRKIKKNGLFFVVRGYQSDGAKYIKQAENNGAIAFVLESDFLADCELLQIKVDDARKALALFATSFYQNPTADFFTAAITGTNGKSSIAFLLYQFWQSHALVSGLIGTIQISFANQTLPVTHTTPASEALQNIFYQMREQKVKCAAIEVSSHALEQARSLGTQWDIAIFTNLTQDHLDHHENMQSYFLAKAKLFLEELCQSSKKNKKALIHCGDKYGRQLIVLLKKKKMVPDQYQLWTYALKKQGNEHQPDFYAIDYQLKADGIWAKIQTPKKEIEITSPLIGLFNLENLIAVIACAYLQGFDLDKIESNISKLKPVFGRMQNITNQKKEYAVLVDYAHTPDALEKACQTLKAVTPKKLIVVFGCGGDRDKTKRPLMAKASENFADQIVVTSDNPRTEDPNQIINDILAGFSHQLKESGQLKTITDRKEAILFALGQAQKGDAVLIAGKGHEDYQILGKEKFPFSDQEVVKEYFELGG